VTATELQRIWREECSRGLSAPGVVRINDAIERLCRPVREPSVFHSAADELVASAAAEEVQALLADARRHDAAQERAQEAQDALHGAIGFEPRGY
jgi:hypothetical protein